MNGTSFTKHFVINSTKRSRTICQEFDMGSIFIYNVLETVKKLNGVV
jgi:hypothetical protein